MAPTFRPKEMAERNAAKTVEQRIQRRAKLNRVDRSSVRIHFAAKNSIKSAAQAAAGRSVINTVLARAISVVDHTLDSEVTKYSLLTR